MHYFIYYVLPLLVVLGVLIFFHELGHFLVAKHFGIKVLKFSLGFGPKVLGKKIGETEYLISAIPLGGYVKMLGESDNEEEDPILPEDEAKSFSHKPTIQRIAVVVAGPLFNLLLALLIFCASFGFSGMQVLTTEIGQVREGSPADNAGLKKGDLIISIDGMDTDTWPQLKEFVRDNQGEPIKITLLRHGQLSTVSVIPEMSVVKNIFGEEIKTPLLGVVSAGSFREVQLGLSGALKEGCLKTWEIIKLTCLTVVKLFQGIVSIKTLGGPILIGQMTGQLVEQSWTYLIPFTAVISINLGILNLLPIPVLDGGFIIFLLIELIIGRPLNIRKREFAQKLGIGLLVLLMVVVIYNDITRILQ
ncbi:MAG: RIP metalloprotease RseP [Deltaproteobacteria bacterium]|nr:RIP metalloprotease RseP [Deltaproteobacteria bacterium]